MAEADPQLLKKLKAQGMNNSMKKNFLPNLPSAGKFEQHQQAAHPYPQSASLVYYGSAQNLKKKIQDTKESCNSVN